MVRVCVTCGAGFIGSHLVNWLKERGYYVRVVDIKLPRWGWPGHKPDEALLLDMRDLPSAKRATEDMDEVYALAADMGGIGFITAVPGQIIQHNTLINLNTAEAARYGSVRRLFFASSACVYPEFLQMDNERIKLAEGHAWKGRPDTAYGSEKLYAEEVYRWMGIEKGIPIRIARFHNVFGPYGDFASRRAKLPGAACWKVSQAKREGRGDVPIWGTGEAVRSFLYVDDAVRLAYLLMRSDCAEPLNIGSDHGVTVNEVFDLVSEIAGWAIEKVYEPGKPVGVMYRNADLSEMVRHLATGPHMSLEEGLRRTYAWVDSEPMDAKGWVVTQTNSNQWSPPTTTGRLSIKPDELYVL